MLLSNASGSMEVCHQFLRVGLVVNHNWVLQEMSENHIHWESGDLIIL